MESFMDFTRKLSFMQQIKLSEVIKHCRKKKKKNFSNGNAIT